MSKTVDVEAEVTPIETRGSTLSRQFYQDHKAAFDAVKRKRNPLHREFVYPVADFWQWCVDTQELATMPTGSEVDAERRHGLKSRASRVAKLISSTASNPAHITPDRPAFRIKYDDVDKSAMRVQLLDAFARELTTEPMREAARFIKNKQKKVRQAGRWARANPEMPNAPTVAASSSLADSVMDEFSTCLIRIAAKITQHRIPALRLEATT